MLNNVKRGIVILLSLCLAALAGCSLAYVDSADAKVSVTGEAEQLSLTLATAKGEVEYRSLSASGTGSFTFPSVYFGDYIVKAYGYEDGQLTGLGEGSISVSADGDNSTSLELVRISNPSTSNEVELTVSWTGAPVDELVLVCGEAELASQSVEGGSATFTAAVAATAQAEACLSLRWQGHEVGRSGSFILSGGSVALDLGQIELSPLDIIGDLSLSYGDDLASLSYSFSLPEDCQSIIIRYSDDMGSYENSYEGDEITSSTVDGIFTGSIDKIRSGSDYMISVTVIHSDGTKSLTATDSIMAPVPLLSVTIARPSATLQPGDEGIQLTTTTYPVDATDLGGSWSTSDSSVASVDQNGMLTINSFGTCTISYVANNGNRRAELLIVVSMLTPQVEVIAHDDGISLSWTGSTQADRHEVYRSIDGGSEELVATVYEAGFFDSHVLAGHSYSYRIRSFDSESGANASSDQTAPLTIEPPVIAIILPEGPQKLEVEFASQIKGLVLKDGEEKTITVEIASAEKYEWSVNNKLVGTDKCLTLTTSMDGIHLGQEEAVQSLSLVVTDEEGRRFSGSARFIVDKG